MPSRDASFGATPVLPRIARAAVTVALVAIAAFCVLLLAVRFVVFPRVEDYRDDLVATLSRQLKAPVEIDALATGWDGWNPKLVIRGFRIRSSVSPDAAPVLELPQVDLVVAWTSLPLVDLRLKRLSVEQPRLSIRRDRAGILHVAGMELDPTQATDDSPLADWVLRQPHIAVHDAVIAWNDDLRNAPQLVLEHVNVRLDSRFGRHRFGLVGTPPGELAAPMDIRGDVRGGGQGDWRRASGKVYVRLDYADLAAFSEWLPLPVPIASGKGALRLWLDFAARRDRRGRRRPRARRRQHPARAEPARAGAVAPGRPDRLSRGAAAAGVLHARPVLRRGGRRAPRSDRSRDHAARGERQQRGHRPRRVRPAAALAAARARGPPAASGPAAHRPRAVRAAGHARPRAHPLGGAGRRAGELQRHGRIQRRRHRGQERRAQASAASPGAWS